MTPTAALCVSALMLTPFATAQAEEPAEVSVSADGSVVGRMVIDANEQEIRAAIPDLQKTGVSSSVLEARIVPDGSCSSVFRKTRGLARPLEMQTRFCPTATGWRESLVASEDFNAYETEWVIRPQPGGGSQVQLRVVSDVNLMVPSSLVRSSTISGVRESLTDLLARLLERRKK
jgi:hypothetical protein